MEGSVDSDLKYHFHFARVPALITPHGTDVHQRNKVLLPQTSSISANSRRVKTHLKSWDACLGLWRTLHFHPAAVAAGRL